ncbi:aryl-sulfate sulfotransferase [Sphingomonas paeninsulae]|uniref:Aryl-sulfate sulfotransferase n=1 Tax=Sphingomonas paeninsulae TaxID=2319844 RepID=A0A494TFX0_SPHPE|nr:ribbon-helix-helix domain-containing protein [Sphingomonas paeninsulae]AYJ86172.1 aryl-sulfate sulfotransferase [Sphingomonas paeninsulae]
MSGEGKDGTTFVYRSPVKHSVTIAGHETAITLEPIFWTALRVAAQAQSLPLNALIARIDVERIATADPPNLASAIRQWLMVAAQSAKSSQP